MGFQKRSDYQSLTERVKNTAIGLGVGALAIYAGTQFYGEMIPSTPIYKEYNTKNPETIAMLKDVDKAIDFGFDYGLPVLFIVAGAASTVWGLSNAANITYRK